MKDVVCSVDITDDNKQAHQSSAAIDVKKRNAKLKKINNLKK